MSVVEKILAAAGIKYTEFPKFGIGKGGKVTQIEETTMGSAGKWGVRRPRGHGAFKYNNLQLNDDAGADSGAGDHHSNDES